MNLAHIVEFPQLMAAWRQTLQVKKSVKLPINSYVKIPDPSIHPTFNLVQVECREDTRDTCVLEEVMDPRMIRDGRDGTTVSKMWLGKSKKSDWKWEAEAEPWKYWRDEISLGASGKVELMLKLVGLNMLQRADQRGWVRLVKTSWN